MAQIGLADAFHVVITPGRLNLTESKSYLDSDVRLVADQARLRHVSGLGLIATAGTVILRGLSHWTLPRYLGTAASW